MANYSCYVWTVLFKLLIIYRIFNEVLFKFVVVYGKVFVADFYKTCSRSSLFFFCICMYGGIKDKFNLFEKADSGTVSQCSSVGKVKSYNLGFDLRIRPDVSQYLESFICTCNARRSGELRPTLEPDT